MTPPAEVAFSRLCIDANDADLLCAYWIDLFGYRLRETDSPDDGWRHLEPPSPALPALTVQPVPEAKTVKNRLHLDVWVHDPDPWIARAVSLGGTLGFRSEDPDDWFQVITDPEGNEFCICRVDHPTPGSDPAAP